MRNFQRVMGRSRLRFDEELLQTLAAERTQHVPTWDVRRDALEECVQQLDPAGRELVDAVHIRGEAIKAVAEQAGRPLQSFYNRLSVIRRMLAECVQRKLAEASS